jgi:hypothetical protein
VSWEESMSGVLDDLEQQAAGLHLAERDAEVAEMSLAEYSRVTLAERLHASLGHDLRVRLAGGDQLSGRLARCGPDWLLLVDHGVEWIVRCEGLTSVTGLSSRADSEETWSVADRLSVRSVLRRLAGQGAGCVVRLADGDQARGRVGRVGQDFLELHVGAGAGSSVQVVPLHAVTALQEQQ